MKVSTSELTGAALDWAVAKCEGLPIRHDPMNFGRAFPEGGFWIWDDRGPIGKRDYRLIGRQYSPSINWAQGGPIIEREEIHLLRIHTSPEWVASAAYRSEGGKQLIGWRRLASGPTPLIAAMRCFVVSKLGNEIEVPDVLLEN